MSPNSDLGAEGSGRYDSRRGEGHGMRESLIEEGRLP